MNDIFKGTGSGFCVSGHVETGMVSLGDKVLVLPQNEIAVVKGKLLLGFNNSGPSCKDYIIRLYLRSSVG